MALGFGFWILECGLWISNDGLWTSMWLTARTLSLALEGFGSIIRWVFNLWRDITYGGYGVYSGDTDTDAV